MTTTTTVSDNDNQRPPITGLTEAETRVILELREIESRRRHQMLIIRVDQPGNILQLFTVSATVRIKL